MSRGSNFGEGEEGRHFPGEAARMEGAQRRQRGGFFGSGLRRFGRADGARGCLKKGREGDSEQVAKRTQDAGGGFEGGRRGGGKGGLGLGIAQQVFKLGGVAGGLVAKLGDQPGAAAGEPDGGRAALAAGTGRVSARQAAGGQGGEEICQAAPGAADAIMQPGAEVAEDIEAAEDEPSDGRKYPLQPLGQLSGWMRGEG